MISNVSESTVRLEPFRREHLEATLNWVNDPRVADPFMLPAPISKDSHQRWFDGLAERVSERLLAILESPGGAHVGNLGFKAIDEHHRKAEIWIYLGPDFQGRGHSICIGSEFLWVQHD